MQRDRGLDGHGPRPGSDPGGVVGVLVNGGACWCRALLRSGQEAVLMRCSVHMRGLEAVVVTQDCNRAQVEPGNV